jgi:hypothetical protein
MMEFVLCIRWLETLPYMHMAPCRYEDGELGVGEPGIPAPTNSTTLRAAIHQLRSLIGWNFSGIQPATLSPVRIQVSVRVLPRAQPSFSPIPCPAITGKLSLLSSYEWAITSLKHRRVWPHRLPGPAGSEEQRMPAIGR